jgi:hypothetical protein
MILPKRRVCVLSSQQIRPQTVLLACGLALAAAGCTSASVNSLIDKLPSSVGLPVDAPERPDSPPAYPAVHDMPPPRANSTLTAEEQLKLEQDLNATRVRQEILTGTTPSAPKRAQPPAAQAAPRVVPAVNTTSGNSIY